MLVPKLGMRAVILAGGESSRFWPLNGRHKSLLEVAGRPLIERTISNMPRSVDEVVVVEPADGCVSCALKDFLTPHDVEFRVQDKPRGMWDAILIGAQDYGDDVLVASGHQFSRFALDKLSAGRGTKLLLSNVPDPHGYGVARVDSIYRLSHDFVQRLGSAEGKDHYLFEKVLSDYLKDHPARFEVVPKEEIPSLKYPWDALSVMERVLEELKGGVMGEVSEQAVVHGDVLVDDGASVMAGAHIYGPAYLGRGAVVGTGSLVRQSCLESGAVAGFGTEVARSLVGPCSKLHHCYVGDSVLARDVWMGFGGVTANRRFDKDEVTVRLGRKQTSTGRGHFGCAVGPGVRMGVKAMLMPGVLVGQGVTVGPGTIVGKNVPDGKKIYVRQETTVK
jgi:NDP-sugar pyrophosphorylase family protein